MRKIKLKLDVKKEFESKKTYITLLWCLSVLVDCVKEIFGVSPKKILGFVSGEIKQLDYKSELLNEQWYPNLYKHINKILRLAYKIRYTPATDAILSKEFVNSTLRSETTDYICLLNNVYIHDKHLHTTTDKNVIKVLLLYAIYKTFKKLIYSEDIKEHLDKNQIKEIKTFITQSREVFEAIFYDMCNYKGYIYERKNTREQDKEAS